MPAMHASSGPARVVKTASFTSFQGHPLEVELEGEGEDEQMTLVLSFEGADAPGPCEPTVETTLAGERRLELRFQDVGCPGGMGSREPVELGELDGERLFLHYRVYTLEGSPDPLVHLTLFLAG